MARTSKIVVFVLNGHGRAGKDTAAGYMMETLTSRGWSTANLSSVSLVKSVLTDLHVPWERKTPAERDLMAGMQAALLKYDWLPLKWLRDEIETRSMIASKGAYFVHIREPDAIAKFKELMAEGGIPVRTVLVDRPGIAPCLSNSADAAVETQTYDLILKNDGSLAALRATCFDFVNRLEGQDDDYFRTDHPAIA